VVIANYTATRSTLLESLRDRFDSFSASMQRYVAKHPFQGDARQAQLSFPQGTLITAKVGQSGAWWWGVANGVEGWFPPTYVTVAPQQQQQPQQQPGPTQPAPAMSMQQRMQQASFTSSVNQQQQQQQQRPAYPQQGYPQQPMQQGYPQQQQRPPQSTAYNMPAAVPQPVFAPADPFAGLDNMNGLAGNAFGATTSQLPSPESTMSTGFAQQATQSMGALPSLSPLRGSTAAPTLASSNTMSYNTNNLPSPSSLSQGSFGQPQTPQPQQQKTTSPMAPAMKNRTMSALPTPAGAKQATDSTQQLRTPPRSSKSFSSASSRDGSHQTPTTSPKVNTNKSPPPRSRSQSSPKGGASLQGMANDVRIAPVAGTRSPHQLSPEELKALQEREREEAQQKAQLRREKAEMKGHYEPETNVGGIGTSGITVAPIVAEGEGDGEKYITFNPFDYLSGTTGGKPARKFFPIYRVPPFWAMLGLQSYISRQALPPEQLKDRAAMYERLAKALSFVSHVCAESPSLKFLRFNHMACEACIKLISILPHSAGASGKNLDALFLNFINVFVPLVDKVQPNQQLVLPGGWQQPDYCNLCLYVVRNCGDNKWSFTVCSTSKDGLEYHPSSFDPETGRQLKQLAMTIWEIPSARLLDSTFWILLFRMQVYPSRKNTAEFLYTKLLPALNSRPLLSNLDQGPAEYLEVPDPISASTMHPLANLALTTSPAIGRRSSAYSTLLLMTAALGLAYKEIENAPAHSLDPEDTRILKLAGRNLSSFAATMDPSKIGDNTLLAGLSTAWDFLDRFLKKVNYTASRPMDQYSHGLSKSAMADEFSRGIITSLKTSPGSAAHPLFGRIRRDDYENVVKRLMGDPRQDPILIPAVLTDDGLPPVATDYATAASSLQRVADACSLLLQQRRLVKNSPAFAASAAQYVLTHILPMPNADPKFCFWRKSEMRRETQVNLLFLIRRIVRIYSAATACVQQSRGLVAIRSIALAAGTCVADAICRVKAIDDPSAFCLHYSGLCEGPTEPFGIEAGSFDSLGSNLPIYDPVLCALRFQCLDYLRGLTLKDDGTKRNTIFNFDKSLTAMDGDLVLLNQLSIQLAFQRPHPPTPETVANHATMLISGRNGSMLEVLPDFEYFRDIVFAFRHAVSGRAQTAPDVPDTHTWLPSDATLHWDVRRVEKDNPVLEYAVKAFHGHPQEFVEVVAQQATIKTKQKGFLSLFSSKEREVRARLSSADPNTVINSCGEKFLNKR
jgi:Variant SH3 domain